MDARERQRRSKRDAVLQDWRTRVVTANDLQAMTFPPVRHILPGYIPEGATILASKPKFGKCLSSNCLVRWWLL